MYSGSEEASQEGRVAFNFWHFAVGSQKYDEYVTGFETPYPTK
jgi:hypothetical protein